MTKTTAKKTPKAAPKRQSAAAKPAAKAATKATAKATTKATVKAATKPSVKTAAKSGTRTAAKSGAKTAAKPDAKTATKPAAGTATSRASSTAAKTTAAGAVAAVGRPVPAFSAEATGGRTVSSSSLAGRPYVLYFYPKDDTPGCTVQACGLRDRFREFEARGAVVLGVSPDPVDSHRAFRDKYGLPFRLLADTEHRVAEAYGVWKELSFAGRKFWGNERTTFVIDEEGRIARIFPRVKPEEHVGQVIEVL